MNHLTVEVQCLLIKILPFLLVVSLRKHLFMRAEETYLMISHGGGVIFKNGVLGCLLCCYIPIFSKVKSKDLSQLADSSQQWWLKMYHVWISQFRSVKVAIGLLGFVLASTTIVLSSSEVWLWSHCPPFETYRWLFHNFLCKELWPASMPPRASWWIICPNSLWTQGSSEKLTGSLFLLTLLPCQVHPAEAPVVLVNTQGGSYLRLLGAGQVFSAQSYFFIVYRILHLYVCLSASSVPN